MNSCRRLLSAVAFSFLAAVLSSSASEQQWVEIQSPHFSVVTDAGEKRGREVAVRFEQMRSVFATLMTKAKVNIPIPLQIVAFRNSKELRQVVPLWHNKPVQVAGLFEGGQDRCFIMLDMSVENPWAVVFHEYAHQLMSGNISAQLDPWFQEGFAEYFSSIEVNGKQARLGKVPDYDYQILHQQGWMKVADLLRVQQNSATYNESGDHRTVFYAESSMLVHYLYDNGLIPKLTTFFSLKIDKSASVEDAIQQSFGVSAAEFDQQLRNYVTDGRYRYYALASPADIVKADYASKPISQLDSSAIIADIHLHSPDYHQQAAAEFQAILKSDPNNAAASRGLGYTYLQSGNFEEAAGYFKRAAQADSKDPRVHYYSALLRTREGTFVDASGLKETINELQTAISLDPNFADAYSLLGFAQSQVGDMKNGLAAMNKAISLNPGNESYRFNLAQMYLSDRQTDPAIAIFAFLSHSSNPIMAMRANQSLATAREFKARIAAEMTMVDNVASASSEQVVSPHLETGSSSDVSAPTADSTGAMKFLKGTITHIDCSSPPTALLTVAWGKKTMSMRVADTKNVLLIGADTFSCTWKNQKVAINYRETAETSGTVVSLEIQQ